MRIALSTAIVLACLGQIAPAFVLDFELTATDPHTPDDNGPQFTPYPLPGGGTVRFFFDKDGDNSFNNNTDVVPRFEAAGQDGSDGFVSNWNGSHDIEAPGYAGRLGNFFLRQPNNIGPLPGPFIIDYNTTQVITAMSGEIWDIDHAERWRVEALSTADAVLATLTSPAGTGTLTPLDSKPWVFQFTNLPPGFDKVRVTYIGDDSDDVGLAFDNFNPTFAGPKPGDANGDGVIGTDDFALIDRGFARHDSGFSNGDFTGDGVIDQYDYLAIDQAFADQGSAPSPSLLAQRQLQFGDDYVRQLLASVPEPVTLIPAIAATLSLRRTHRARRERP